MSAQRPLRSPWLLVILTLLSLAIAGCPSSGSQQTQNGTTEAPQASGLLEVHFLDIGQGDAAIIITPDGHVVLIDGGPSSHSDDLIAELRALGVSRINLMIVSHAHADHIGGFEDVFDHFEVMRYGDPGFGHSSQMYASLLRRLANHNVPSWELRRGQELTLDDDVTMTVLAPGDRLLSGTRSDVNANSLVLLLEYGDISMLFTGDSEADTERELLSLGLVGDIDVLKVAHHGSHYSSTAAFLEATNPELSIVSCGRGNSYGHPAPEAMERFAALPGNAIYRTDIDGTVTVTTDGSTLNISRSGVRAQ